MHQLLGRAGWNIVFNNEDWIIYVILNCVLTEIMLLKWYFIRPEICLKRFANIIVQKFNTEWKVCNELKILKYIDIL